MAGRLPTSKTIREQTRDIKACREADVPVERYGHLGGTGTGGPVTIIPAMSDINGKQQIAGITQEWIDGLDACRVFPSDLPVQDYLNLIPHCIVFGQAAGTVALAIQNGPDIREVDYRALQDSLIKQGVPLPGVYTALSKA